MTVPDGALRQAFCLDLFQPSGHGRRRRSARASVPQQPPTTHSTATNLTSFGDNIGIKVVMPEGEQLPHY